MPLATSVLFEGGLTAGCGINGVMYPVVEIWLANVT